MQPERSPMGNVWCDSTAAWHLTLLIALSGHEQTIVPVNSVKIELKSLRYTSRTSAATQQRDSPCGRSWAESLRTLGDTPSAPLYHGSSGIRRQPRAAREAQTPDRDHFVFMDSRKSALSRRGGLRSASFSTMSP